MSRKTLLPQLAAYALQHGFSDASLRPMAKAAGTSDRMLLYHFGSKQALMDALMEHIADMYSATLDAMFPPGRAATRKECLDAVITMTRRDEIKPFLRLWWQVVAGAASGEAEWRGSAGRIMGTLLEWLEGHLPEDDPDPPGTAELMLAVIEGTQMLEAVGRRDIADAAIASAFAD